MTTHNDIGSSEKSNFLTNSRSPSQIIDSIGYGRFQIILTILIGVSNLSDAMEMMILSLIGPILTCSSWKVSTTSVASLTTVVFLAMSIGSPIWGFLTDNYGRRKVLVGSSALLLLFGIASALSPSFIWLLIFRFFVGMLISCMPQGITLLMEYLPSESRGRANIFLALIWACGGSTTILIGRLCMYINAEYQWRVIVAMGAAPLLLFIVFSCWIPESVLYLIQTKQKSKAEEIINYMQKLNSSSSKGGYISFDDPENEESRCISEDKVNHVLVVRFLKGFVSLVHPKRWKLTFLVWFQWLFVGITYYGMILLSTELVRIWDQDCPKTSTNVRPLDSEKIVQNACIQLRAEDYFYIFWASLAEFPGGLLALYAMDIIGRKKTFAVTASLFTLSLSFVLIGCSLSKTVLTILLFIARGSCVAYGQCLTVYTPEVYPTHIRALGVGAAFTFVRVGGMVTPYFSHVLVAYSWTLSIIVYSLFGLLLTLISFCLPLESKGLDMSSMDQETIKSKPGVEVGSPADREEQCLLIASENE